MLHQEGGEEVRRLSLASVRTPGELCLFCFPLTFLESSHSSLIEGQPASNRSFEEELAPASKPEGTWA